MHVIINKQQRGAALKLSLYVVSKILDSKNNTVHSLDSDPIAVDNMALVRFKLHVDTTNNKIESKFAAKISDDSRSSIVKLYLSFEDFEKDMICSKNWSEDITIEPKHNLKALKVDSNYGGLIIYAFVFHVTITVQDASYMSLIANQVLFGDKQFTDFQLRTSDGSVSVHKVVLAAHSEVFKSLLSEESRETFGQFNIQGVTVQTLEHLKEYMYLGKLPTTELPQLLLVAVYSKMSGLRDACIAELTAVITPEDLDPLIDFAIRNNIPELVRAMLSYTPDSVVDGAHRLRKNKLPFCTLQLNQLALTDGEKPALE